MKTRSEIAARDREYADLCRALGWREVRQCQSGVWLGSQPDWLSWAQAPQLLTELPQWHADAQLVRRVNTRQLLPRWHTDAELALLVATRLRIAIVPMWRDTDGWAAVLRIDGYERSADARTPCAAVTALLLLLVREQQQHPALRAHLESALGSWKSAAGSTA